jgi:heat shock protein HslJ
VRELQQQLKALGYDPGVSDGVYGQQTAGAVRRFQQATGLSVDGVVGQQTWRWLRAQIWRLWWTQQLPAQPADASATPGAPLPDTSVLADTQWQLEVFGDPSHPQAVVAGSEPTIEFSAADWMVKGSMGCNTYAATYTVDETRLTLGEILFSAVECTDPKVTEQEGQLYLALPTIERYQLNGDQLELICKNGTLMRFKALK